MKITVVVDNDSMTEEEAEAWFKDHPNADALSPREIAEKLVAFREAMNERGQVVEFGVVLPWWNDDSGDIASCLADAEAPMGVHQVRDFEHILNAVL